MKVDNENSAMRSISNYRVLKKLGSGATSEVFIAETQQEQPVALKVFKEDPRSARNTEIVKRELKYAMKVSSEGMSS